MLALINFDGTMFSTWTTWSNSLSPHMDQMKHSPAAATSSMHLSSPVCAMPSSSQTSGSNYSPVSSGVSPVPIIDETTSDVPLSNTMMRSPFVPKMEDTCSDSGMYSMDTIINSRSPMMSNRVPLVNKPSSSMMGEGTSSQMNENPSGNTQNKFFPNFEMSSKPVIGNVPWLPNHDPEGSEANIESWLGQIFKYDNLVPGLSLPQKQEQ